MKFKLDVPDFQRSKSRKVNAYVKALALRSAARILARDAEAAVGARRAALTGGQMREAETIVAAGPVVRMVPGTRASVAS